MKFPKHRANVFLVERMVLHNEVYTYSVVGVFPTLEAADEFAGTCKQDFIERGFSENDFIFKVAMSTYYDA